MARTEGQRGFLLELLNLLERETDSEHGLTIEEMGARLEAEGFPVNRKTTKDYLQVLEEAGYDITSWRDGHAIRYAMSGRDFELPELKILVDLVQSSRFITQKKSGELIGKLEKLCSTYQAGQLQRQVQISGRVKSENQRVYYNVDGIHDAINGNTGILFQYFQWNNEKKAVNRHNGQWYDVSPWKLIWDNENYYLMAYDNREKKIKHFRVDKMVHIRSDGQPRQGREVVDTMDLSTYANTLFGMFGGTPVRVTLEGEGYLAGAVIDRFGTDIYMRPLENGRFSAAVEVVPSQAFFGWIMGLGKGIRITAPEGVVQQMREEITRLHGQYFSE